MGSKPRKNPERKWETHVYLTEADHKLLQQRAEEECRSVTMQVLHYIKRGLAEDDRAP